MLCTMAIPGVRKMSLTILSRVIMSAQVRMSWSVLIIRMSGFMVAALPPRAAAAAVPPPPLPWRSWILGAWVAASGAFGLRLLLSVVGGWRTVRRLRIAPLVIGTALSELPFSGPMGVAMVLRAQERGWHPGMAGAMLTAFSLGGLAISLLMSALPRSGGRLTVLGSAAATAGLLLLFGMSADAVPAVLCSAGLGVASGVTQVICQGQVQRSTPVTMLGRVTAVLTLLTLGLSPLAYAGVGLVADLAGLPVFFAVAAGVIVLSGLLLATARFGPPRAITPIAA